MAYDLEKLRPSEGSHGNAKRKGRGRSSGMGKTCCRGHNGEGQRAGRSKKRGFEGGQMPSFRKIPKLKGFELVNPIFYAEINIGQFEKLEGDVFDLAKLKELGLARNKSEELRVLGNGELTRAITIKARHFTKSAKEKLEKAGGKIELV